MKGKSILITGAGGFTGMHACEYFAGIGMQVYASVRHLDTNVLFGEKIVCDMMHKEQIYAMVRQLQPDYVLHLAGRNSVPESWKEPVSYLETNVMSTFYLLDALREIPKCRTLVIGSKLKFDIRVTSQPPHPYSLSKTMQQMAVNTWVHLFGQFIMLAEPSNLIGPGPSTGICALLARKMVQVERNVTVEPFRLSSTEETRDFLDIRDAVRAYRIILENGKQGQSYPIESGKLLRLGEVFQTFQHYARTPIPVEVAGNDAGIHAPVHHANPFVMNELGWQARIPFDRSVQDIIQYFRNQ
ncbi:NAD-dependent epimerase/dehydratase family protein [Paenibacillus guangzhouensis]|uniref:NAD-dependent epimerase/dehydratase family protein n=1 Tax=Paenibacillus guangzhouensis TaxID=1473112 RepID=UPI0012675DEC|nr:NAD-dependent epimerase/dehydratase family protein [Paenibacillus guangzhouensis]